MCTSCAFRSPSRPALFPVWLAFYVVFHPARPPDAYILGPLSAFARQSLPKSMHFLRWNLRGRPLTEFPRESIRAVFLAERALKVEHSVASNTFTARSEQYNGDQIHARRVDKRALSFSVMICAPQAGRPAFRVGAWDRNGRKHCEDGADDHISERGAKSLSFAARNRGAAEVATKKVNVFAEWDSV